MTQFISGHGDFKSKLESFQLSEEDTCDCGMEETPQHIIEVCPLFEEERQKLRNSIHEAKLTWPREKWEFVTKDMYPHFQKFTRSVLLANEHKRREALQRTKGAPASRKQTEEQPDRLPRRSARKAQQAREADNEEPTEPQQQS
jgi:hypothetical protein